MNDWIDYLKTLPWKEWSIAFGAGALSLFGIWWSGWDKRVIARDGREARASEAREVSRNTLEIAQGQDLTARFKALMDGYESRILDVSTELAQTRKELREVRDLLTAHQNRCRACPYYTGLEPINAAG